MTRPGFYYIQGYLFLPPKNLPRLRRQTDESDNAFVPVFQSRYFMPKKRLRDTVILFLSKDPTVRPSRAGIV